MKIQTFRKRVRVPSCTLTIDDVLKVWQIIRSTQTEHATPKLRSFEYINLRFSRSEMSMDNEHELEEMMKEEIPLSIRMTSKLVVEKGNSYDIHVSLNPAHSYIGAEGTDEIWVNGVVTQIHQFLRSKRDFKATLRHVGVALFIIMSIINFVLIALTLINFNPKLNIDIGLWFYALVTIFIFASMPFFVIGDKILPQVKIVSERHPFIDKNRTYTLITLLASICTIIYVLSTIFPI